jgi:hypothetical protein
MNRTTKIILISTGGLVVAVGAFLGVRYLIRKRQEKKQSTKSVGAVPPPKDFVKPTVNSTTTSTSAQANNPSVGTTQMVTSLGVPVVLVSNPSPSGQSAVTYNANSTMFKRLDSKLKSLYRIGAIVDKKDGKLIFVEDGDFKPSKPNTELGMPMQETLWREFYNSLLDISKGFNSGEQDVATKNYGNILIDIFKTQRMDFLFPPKTSDGKLTKWNPSAEWYKKVEKENEKYRTDFWTAN